MHRTTAAAAALVLPALTVMSLLNAEPARAVRPAAGPAAGDARVTAPPRTVVSLTFDDGDADQMAAARVLGRYGLPATYYIITGAIGAPGYMTLADLRELAASGNEIGGHTVSHLDLTAVAPAEARRQVCQSRQTLAAWGFRAVSFAYPGGGYDPAAEAIVAACGYSTARITDGLSWSGCPACRVTETVPPANPYAVRTPGQVDASWTLADLENAVLTAQRSGGGWLPLIFHHACAAGQCGGLSISTPVLGAFARWLSAQRDSGIVVRTVADVASGPVRPLVKARPASPHSVINPSLEKTGPSAAVHLATESDAGAGAFPRCWMQGGFGVNTAIWQRTASAHSGHWAERLTITSYTSGDAKLVQRFDLGECSLPVTPGHAYQLGTWYRSTARTQFSAYYRTATGRWVYWTSSPYVARSGQWAHAVWQTPPVPAGASGLSYGLALFSKGTLTTDDYSFQAVPPDTARSIADWTLLILLALAGAAVLGRLLAKLARPAKAAQPGPAARRAHPARPGPAARRAHPAQPGPAARGAKSAKPASSSSSR